MVVIKQQVSWSCNPWGLDPLGVIELASVVFFWPLPGGTLILHSNCLRIFHVFPKLYINFAKNSYHPSWFCCSICSSCVFPVSCDIWPIYIYLLHLAQCFSHFSTGSSRVLHLPGYRLYSAQLLLKFETCSRRVPLWSRHSAPTEGSFIWHKLLGRVSSPLSCCTSLDSTSMNSKKKTPNSLTISTADGLSPSSDIRSHARNRVQFRDFKLSTKPNWWPFPTPKLDSFESLSKRPHAFCGVQCTNWTNILPVESLRIRRNSK